ncbi:MAG: ABC transporter permease subunit [Dehalogenimonas sp.]|uniref:ABC transporter permease subunit n=1 Tax=Candidatus Dehalogenimonas loeffleri TaxID=3127115 RepID=A0ABZ2J6S6_9CHLR|nr:ABC transporter permease subunit [Dehalogenimonas sp.]
MNNENPKGRMIATEYFKLTRNKTVIIILLVMIVFVALFATVPGNEYKVMADSFERLTEFDIAAVDRGSPVILSEWPESYDPEDYPLVDSQGKLIPENAEVYKRFIREHYQAKIDALTAEGGRYEMTSLLSQGARQGAGILAVLSLVMAVNLVAGEFNSGSYRVMVSRGVRRHRIMTAKILVSAALAVVFTVITTVTLLITIRLFYDGFGAIHPATLSLGIVWNVFWVFGLIAVAYMALGGFLGIFLASPGSAVMVGIVIGLVSTSFFSVTPCGQGLFATISPATMGYNFGSIMHYMWPGQEFIGGASGQNVVIVGGSAQTVECFRGVGPAVALVLAYISLFTALVYGIFQRKELKE